MKIGIISLGEYEWVEALGQIDSEDLLYIDFVTSAKEWVETLSKIFFYKEKQKNCDFVFALTHLRLQNDQKLAREVPGLDLILGGHDHIYHHEQINQNLLIKSGSDFLSFSLINMTRTEGSNFAAPKEPLTDENVVTGEEYKYLNSETGISTSVQKWDVTAEIKPDSFLENFVKEKYTNFDIKSKQVNSYTMEVLDCRFNIIRSKETKLGNFIADLIRKDMLADVGFINSGALRADKIFEKGPMKSGDWIEITPFGVEIVKLKLTGKQLKVCLEVGVSSLPDFDGRFLQISGVKFTYDPSKPKFKRIDNNEIFVGENLLDLEKSYSVATSGYLFDGNDGFDILKSAEVMIDEENGPSLSLLLDEFFSTFFINKRNYKKEN